MSRKPFHDPPPANATALILAALALAVLAACGGKGSGGGISTAAPSTPEPHIVSVLPSSGPVDTPVRITGQGLAMVSGVTFTPGIAASFDASDLQVTTSVPPGARTGPITFTTLTGKSTSIPFTVPVVSAAPVLDGFDPAKAPAYTRMKIVGRNLADATAVTIGGAAAAWFNATDTEILTTVPAGAASGKVVVTTPAGTATSTADFTLDPGMALPPSILRFQPLDGPVNTLVRVYGTGLLAVTKVELSGTSATFRRVSNAELMFTVPGGAATGPVTITGATGTTVSTDPFSVTSGDSSTPTFLGFEPKAGPPLMPVKITGTGLSGIISATVGGKPAVSSSIDDSNLTLWIPESGAVSGPIVLTHRGGTITHPTPFTLVHPRPVISRITPPAGPEGTSVMIEGRNLEPATEILFGTTQATSVSYEVNSIRALVPRGATSGPVTVTGPGGSTRSTQVFTVRAATSTSNRWISGMYITQATQRMDRSVPLVAGRPGRVRVFLESDSTLSVAPSVQVTVSDSAGGVLVSRNIAPPRRSMPLFTDDTREGQSWDFTLDGRFIQPGNAILARIIGGGADLSAADDVYPSDGAPLPLNVVTAPPIGITLIPVNQGGTTGRVSDATRPLESWLTEVREVWPLNEINLVKAPVMTWSEPVTADTRTWIRLRMAIEAKRLADDPRNLRYHYGVIDIGPYPSNFGLSDFGGHSDNLRRSAVGWDSDGEPDAQTYFGTFAHELGHSLDRRHSPCGGAAGADPLYPYPDANLGATGFNMATGKVVNPKTYSDIMSYCYPRWVSDYVFKDILTKRAAAAEAPLEAAEARPGLVVWGMLSKGASVVEPAFRVADCSGLPTPGDCTLVLRDASGTILQEVPFEAQEEACLYQEGSTRTFAFSIPLSPQVEAALASMEVIDASSVAEGTVRRASRYFASTTGAALPRDPVATAWGPGTVHLSWDASTHPMVMVTEPSSGAVIGMVEGGSADLTTDARELDLNLSAGVRSVRMRVKVTP